MVVLNTTAYTWDWYCHLVGDRASLFTFFKVCVSLLSYWVIVTGFEELNLTYIVHVHQYYVGSWKRLSKAGTQSQGEQEREFDQKHFILLKSKRAAQYTWSFKQKKKHVEGLFISASFINILWAPWHWAWWHSAYRQSA
jgi:hypothetical protein